MLICTLKGLLGLYNAYIIFWSLVTDCGFVIGTAFAQENCEFTQRKVEICYIILSSLQSTPLECLLHPQYDGQKAIDMHR